MSDACLMANIFTAIIQNRKRIIFLYIYVYFLINFSKPKSGLNHAKCHATRHCCPLDHMEQFQIRVYSHISLLSLT